MLTILHAPETFSLHNIISIIGIIINCQWNALLVQTCWVGWATLQAGTAQDEACATTAREYALALRASTAIDASTRYDFLMHHSWFIVITMSYSTQSSLPIM